MEKLTQNFAQLAAMSAMLSLRNTDGQILSNDHELKHGEVVCLHNHRVNQRDHTFAPQGGLRIITQGTLQLLEHFWTSRPASPKAGFHELCVAGAAGSGKSCAVQVLVADIARRQPDAAVFYCREWVADGQATAALVDSAVHSANSGTETYLVVDQIVDNREAVNLSVRAGTLRLTVILVASANLPHFSVDREGSQHQKSVFQFPFSNPADDCARLAHLLGNGVFEEKLDYSPSAAHLDFASSIAMPLPAGYNLKQFAEWTNGHLLSISDLCLNKHSPAELLREKADRMTQFFQDTEHFSFYLRVVQMFKVKATKVDVTGLDYDLRYMGISGNVLSPLFLQAFQQSILVGPSVPSFYAVSNTALLNLNPTELGFGVEREALQDSKLLPAITLCFKMLGLEQSTVPTKVRARFGYSWFDQVASEAKAALVAADVWALHGIPLKWNEKNVDAILLYFVDKVLYVIGDSISLSTAQEHVKSLAWARELDHMKSALEKVGFDQVQFVLLFTVKQPDSTTTLRTSSGNFQLCNRPDLIVIDYSVVDVMEPASKYHFQLGGMTSFGARRLSLVDVKETCCGCTKGDCKICGCAKASKPCLACASPACTNKPPGGSESGGS
jgi:hypothetical protein